MVLSVKTFGGMSKTVNRVVTFKKNVTLEGNLTIGGSMVFGDAYTDSLTIGGTATISSDNKFYFRDTGLYLWSSADGQLDAVADTKAMITSPTIELEGSSAITLDGDVTVDGAHTFTFGTGAIAVNGDATLAAAKKIYVRDTGLYIYSSTDGTIDIVGDTVAAITAPTITLTGSSKINLDGATDITGILTIDTAGSPADGIKINATTPADALEIASASSANAINISGNQSATAINIAGTAVTGLLVGGATTTGISITGNATDAIKIQTGTFTDAIEIAGTTTNGINISVAVTKGLIIAGNATDGVYISGGTVVDAVEIGACTNAVNISGAVTKGILIAGNATDGIYISGGTVVDAIEVGACTNAFNMSGNVTTGIALAGTSTTGISITGNSTTAISIGTGTFTTGVSIGSATTGLILPGTYTRGLDFAGATLAATTDRSKSLVSVGSRATALDLTVANGSACHFDPIQLNFAIKGVDAGTTSTMNTIYSLITHETADMANMRLKCADWNIVVKKNLQDAYVYQGELDFATNAVAVGGEACAMGLTVSGASAVTGNVWGQIIVMTGSGLPAATSAILKLDSRDSAVVTHGIYLEVVSGATVTNAIYVNDVGTLTNFINATTEGGAIGATRATPNQTATCDGSLKVLIGAKTLYLPLYNAVTVA